MPYADTVSRVRWVELKVHYLSAVLQLLDEQSECSLPNNNARHSFLVEKHNVVPEDAHSFADVRAIDEVEEGQVELVVDELQVEFIVITHYLPSAPFSEGG
jgi:hypothetical protein